MNKYRRNIKWIRFQVAKTLIFQLDRRSFNWDDAIFFLLQWILPISGTCALLMFPGILRHPDLYSTATIFSAYQKLREYKTTQYAYSIFKQKL